MEGMMKKSGRTRLEKLQNSWMKASDDERRLFLTWIEGLGVEFPGERGRDCQAPIASGRYLTPQSIERITAVMRQRSLTLAQLMAEIGMRPGDRSLARAMMRGTSLRLGVVEALQRWLSEHSIGKP